MEPVKFYKYVFTIFNKTLKRFELERYYTEEALEYAEHDFITYGNKELYKDGCYILKVRDLDSQAILKEYDTELDI